MVRATPTRVRENLTHGFMAHSSAHSSAHSLTLIPGPLNRARALRAHAIDRARALRAYAHAQLLRTRATYVHEYTCVRTYARAQRTCTSNRIRTRAYAHAHTRVRAHNARARLITRAHNARARIYAHARFIKLSNVRRSEWSECGVSAEWVEFLVFPDRAPALSWSNRFILKINPP